MDFVKTGDIEEYNPFVHKSDIIIMTGASSNHVTTLLSCLLSFSMAFPHSSLVFVDYGISNKERCQLNTILVASVPLGQEIKRHSVLSEIQLELLS